ncbi:MAG: GNAT family N-acetyltransferase [Alphaproteobacteria bacterium]|nr:GNAT family N-acetyltransferase [Alphaproteobacteria bacterium]
MAELRIELAGNELRDGWNQFLQDMAPANPLARYEWRDILERSYGNEVKFYYAHRGSEIVGVLPGYLALSARRRRRFFPLRAGAVVSDGATLNALINRIQEDARTQGWRDWTVIQRGVARCPGIAHVDRKTVVFSLGETSEKDWASLSQKARNKVRKARNSGMTIESGPQYVDTVYDLYRANMLRLAVPMHSRRFFHAIGEALGSDVAWVVALHGEKPAAGMAVFFGAGGGVHDFQSSTFEQRANGPVQLLNWEAIELCRRRGSPLLDFGESSEGSSVYASKTGFGGEPETLTYYGEQAASRKPRSDSVHDRQSILSIADRLLIKKSPAMVRVAYAQWKRRRGRVL